MNLMEAILGSSGAPVSQISSKFGLGESDINQVISQFLPALTNGVKRNVSQQGGLESLVSALNHGDHERYLDDPESLFRDEAVHDGNGILGHLLGNKKTSRELAKRTAEKTGLDMGILKKILPLVAGVAMGALKKQGNTSGLIPKLSSTPSSSSPVVGTLMSLLDADGESSPIDDILGFASKIF